MPKSSARLESLKKSPAPLVLPAAIWLFFFLLIPVLIVVLYSFLSKGPYGNIVYEFSFANYARAFDSLYIRVVLDSFKLALVTTVFCLLVGYPMAYVMATSSVVVRQLLLLLIIIPFWTNVVVRAYAVKFMLSHGGPLSQMAESLGIAGALSDGTLSTGPTAVIIGMFCSYLPFMVLPLYVTLEKFDFGLFEAARDLGASSWHILSRILLPLTKRGIYTGCALVFIPALGDFVIPDLLGGAKTMLIGNLITEQFLKMRNWPFGSALSVLLILPILAFLIYHQRESAPAKTMVPEPAPAMPITAASDEVLA